MNTLALVPLRSLNNGKQRLAGALTVEERRSLVLYLWRRTRAALAGLNAIEQIVVVSPDPALLRYVERDGVHAIRQVGIGLNAGLEQARDTLVAERDPFRLLVMLPDLPLVRAEDVAELVRVSDPQTVVVAPDRHDGGTNALLLPRPNAIPFCFGQDSLKRHVTAATERGFAIARYHAPGTAIDLDTPDDLDWFRQYAVEQRLDLNVMQDG